MPTMAPETALSLRDILPINPKHYDKNRAPKLAGQPTMVYFHVTVLSLDSINEESMVGRKPLKSGFLSCFHGLHALLIGSARCLIFSRPTSRTSSWHSRGGTPGYGCPRT